jgi:hypothetical protein
VKLGDSFDQHVSELNAVLWPEKWDWRITSFLTGVIIGYAIGIITLIIAATVHST